MYLLFAKNGKVENNLERVCISSNYDDFGDTSVESFCGLVGSLLDLLKGGALGDQVINFGGEIFSGKRGSSF